MLKSDGSTIWVHLSATLAQNADNEPVCRLVLVDITELKRIETELQLKFDELERFNNVTVGRELRMIELKAEVNALLKAAGQSEKYTIFRENT